MRFAPFGPKEDDEIFASVSWADPNIEQALERIDAQLAAISAGASLVDANTMVDVLLDVRLDLLGVRP